MVFVLISGSYSWPFYWLLCPPGGIHTSVFAKSLLLPY